jgi:hypothetical protein
MATVSILPVESASGKPMYQAVSGQRLASGSSVGAALDAFSQQFPDLVEEGMIVVQRFRPDKYFTAGQQQRLQDLMARWRKARDSGQKFPDADQSELESLVNEELVASSQRAEDAARGLGK